MKTARCALTVALFGILAGLAFGAQQMTPAKRLLVKNPSPNPEWRKIVYKVVEKASSHTVIGDPTVNGAKLRVALTPGGDQCFTMPAGGWQLLRPLHPRYEYRDPMFANGPVKFAWIQKKDSGEFRIVASLLGKGSTTITVVPGNPTTSYATNLSLGGGDEYCSGSGSAFPDHNDAEIFNVRNDTAPTSCAITACSPSGAFLDAVPGF